MDPVTVPVGDCRCPATPHDHDEVYLAPELGLTAGLAVEAAMEDNKGDDQTLAVSLAFIRHGITGWTFTDDKGAPVPVTPANIERLLPYARGGEAVAREAAGLYAKAFFSPLAQRAQALSPQPPHNGDQRPILASHRKPRRSSSRAASAGQRSPAAQ